MITQGEVLHSVSPYLLRCFNPILPGPIHERYHALGKVGQHDTFALLRDFIKSKSKSYEIIEETNHVYRFDDIKVDETKREIYGWLKVGSYGLKTDIINIETGDVDFEKADTNAEILPHFVHFHIPFDFNEGIALLHCYSNIGVKTLFMETFQPYFKTITKLNVQMNPLSYDKALKEWQNAVTKEIRIIGFKKLGDIADVVKLGHKEVEMVLKAPRKMGLGKLSDFLNPNSDQAKAVEVLSELGTQIKSVVEMNGKKKIFNIGPSSRNSICNIVLDEAVTLSNGIPLLDDMYHWSSEIIEDYKRDLYPNIKATT